MKPKFYAVFLCVLMIVLPACSSKESKADELVVQGNAYYQKHDYVSARDLYAKALDIYEDSSTRAKYNALNNEITRIKDSTKIHNEIKAIASNAEKVVSENDLLNACNQYFDAISKLEAFDVSPEDNVSTFVENIVNTSEFDFLKTKVMLAQTEASTGIGDASPYDTAKELSDYANKLLDSSPIPEGFSSVQ